MVIKVDHGKLKCFNRELAQLSKFLKPYAWLKNTKLHIRYYGQAFIGAPCLIEEQFDIYNI